MNCQKCSKETFRCPYCGEQFCGEHRLPENHQCSKIAAVQAQKQENASATVPSSASYEYKFTFGPQISPKRRLYMSSQELKHLIPAALLIMGIGFSIAFYNDYFAFWGWTEVSIFASLLTLSFLIHELAHKFTAQLKGLWAEFRLTTWGAVLTLISVFTPFRLIAPGAVMISGSANLSDIGRISIAGPITNISLSLVFLSVAYAPVPGVYSLLFLLIASFNSFIALFNLIPFGVLDGYKIFSWNKKIWAAAFAVSATLTIYTYWLIYL
jgi:Zn-dependent protease